MAFYFLSCYIPEVMNYSNLGTTTTDSFYDLTQKCLGDTLIRLGQEKKKAPVVFRKIYKDLPKGTFFAILKQAGIDKEEFY